MNSTTSPEVVLTDFLHVKKITGDLVIKSGVIISKSRMFLIQYMIWKTDPVM